MSFIGISRKRRFFSEVSPSASSCSIIASTSLTVFVDRRDSLRFHLFHVELCANVVSFASLLLPILLLDVSYFSVEWSLFRPKGAGEKRGEEEELSV